MAYKDLTKEQKAIYMREYRRRKKLEQPNLTNEVEDKIIIQICNGYRKLGWTEDQIDEEMKRILEKSL